MQSESMFISVLVLCLVCAIMLHGFYMYHLYLIWCGYTTNEYMKAGQLISALEKAKGFFERWLAKFENGKSEFKPTQEMCERYLVKGDESQN